jgi:hypothetical protein
MIIMDNFSGRKKNNHVFGLAAYLVEMKFFRNSDFVFYVRGHTKNACDRLFNQIQISFHKDQVHSYRVDLSILNSQPNVTMIDVTEDMFKDYENIIDNFYCNFEAHTIIINSIFKVVTREETSFDMLCSTHEGSSMVQQSMIK